MEIVENDAGSIQSDFIYDDKKAADSSENGGDFLSLKAVCSWDSSVHQSPYLNQITSLDKNVYLTVKINVKLKLISNINNSKSKSNEYIDLVLRKRLAVCICLQSSGPKLMSLNRFKNLLNPGLTKRNSKATSSSSSPNSDRNMTCVTYRIIATIPKLLTEIENRESLAIKAASSINEEATTNVQDSFRNDLVIDSSPSHFERYAKTIEAVDSILKREKVQQKLHLERSIHLLNRNGSNADEDGDRDSSLTTPKKTFSVPNLIKTVNRILNLTGPNIFVADFFLF